MALTTVAIALAAWVALDVLIFLLLTWRRGRGRRATERPT
jgi:hypothetical protein